MLTKKFYAKKAPPPVELYYNGVARTANAGVVTVDANIKADLVIAKRRNGVATSAWFTRLRGALKRIVTSSTAPEVVDTNSLTAFTNSGFTLGADSTQTVNAPNNASFMYWCFAKAAEYLDVVSFIGDGEAVQTVSHQLTVPPELAIGKSRTGTQLWPVLHKSVGNRDMVFNTSGAATVPTGNAKIVGNSIGARSWRGVAFGNGVYVAICKGNTGSNVVAISSDGDAWAEHVIPSMPITGATTGLYGITFFPLIGKFVAFGSDCSYTSADGQTWTKGPAQPSTSFSSAPEQCIAASPTLCAAFNGRTVWTSTDGLNWIQFVNVLTTTQSCISWANGSFVTLPNSGSSVGHWSDDGTTWSTSSVPLANRTWRHLRGTEAGVFVGIGTIAATPPAERTNVMVRSLDKGRTWSTVNLATTQSWGGLAYGNGVFLAGGADSNSADEQSNVINVSFDQGATWSAKLLVAAAYWMYWAHGAKGFVGLSFAVDPNLSARVDISSGSPWLRNPLPASIDVGASFNVLGAECEIALFGSKPGVSKVGSYQGNGVNQNIDCGFPSAARFVMIKKWNAVGNWFVWDSARGVNVGTNDPFLVMNTSAAEVGTDNAIEPLSTGFIVKQTAATDINASGAEYVYLAIA